MRHLGTFHGSPGALLSASGNLQLAAKLWEKVVRQTADEKKPSVLAGEIITRCRAAMHDAGKDAKNVKAT